MLQLSPTPTILTSPSAPQWARELSENGYTIIPSAVPLARAEEYTNSALSWLEGFPLGFKRDDPTTWSTDHLPVHNSVGLMVGNGVSHEEFTWKARTEPKVLETFQQLWGTDELVVSFDAINISLTLGPHGRTDIFPTKPWPHMDQNPLITEFELAQGLIALTPSRKNDGGLVVVKGSHKHLKRFFEETGGFREEQDSGERNFYRYTQSDLEWFLKQPGCEIIKVETTPGSLVLWESRTIHWNSSPTADQTRVAIYVCMAPASFATPEVLEQKKAAFENFTSTTHWPHFAILTGTKIPERDGKPDVCHRMTPINKPLVTDQIRKLAGVLPY